MKPKLLRLHSQDNIVVATAPIKAQTVVRLDRVKLQIVSNVPLAGKVATRPIAEGEKIIKFGQPIGHATRNIEPGEWVHTHNLQSDYLPTPEMQFGQYGGPNGQTTQPIAEEALGSESPLATAPSANQPELPAADDSPETAKAEISEVSQGGDQETQVSALSATMPAEEKGSNQMRSDEEPGPDQKPNAVGQN
ncbi:MAG: UxaA family hydrolase [Thermogutta sp.]